MSNHPQKNIPICHELKTKHSTQSDLAKTNLSNVNINSLALGISNRSVLFLVVFGLQS